MTLYIRITYSKFGIVFKVWKINFKSHLLSNFCKYNYSYRII